jgi:hypothetical protein
MRESKRYLQHFRGSALQPMADSIRGAGTLSDDVNIGTLIERRITRFVSTTPDEAHNRR